MMGERGKTEDDIRKININLYPLGDCRVESLVDSLMAKGCDTWYVLMISMREADEFIDKAVVE